MGLRIQCRGVSVRCILVVLSGFLLFSIDTLYALSPAPIATAILGESRTSDRGSGIDITFTIPDFVPGVTLGKVSVAIEVMEGLSLSDTAFQCTPGLYIATHKIIQQEELHQHELEVAVLHPGEYLLTVEASALDDQGQIVGPVKRVLYFYADKELVTHSEAGALDAHVQALKWHLEQGHITREDYDRQVASLHEGKI